jgi:hypothetical protein
MGHGEFEFKIKFSFRDGLRSFSAENGNDVKVGTEPGSSLFFFRAVTNKDLYVTCIFKMIILQHLMETKLLDELKYLAITKC